MSDARLRVQIPMSSERKFTTLERKITFLINSFTFEGETEQLDAKVEEIDNVMGQLTKLNEKFESGSEEFTLHKQQHYQFTSSLKKIKDKIQEQKDRAKLDLQNVTRYNDGTISIEMQGLMDERRSLGNSNKVALDFLSEAEITKENIRTNNNSLERIRDKTGTVSSTFTTAVSIMGLIKRQKVKHTVVLGVLAGLCVCFILWWWLKSY